jgi:hypothetical protein
MRMSVIGEICVSDTTVAEFGSVLGCVCGYVSGSVTQLYDRKLEIA